MKHFLHIPLLVVIVIPSKKDSQRFSLCVSNSQWDMKNYWYVQTLRSTKQFYFFQGYFGQQVVQNVFLLIDNDFHENEVRFFVFSGFAASLVGFVPFPLLFVLLLYGQSYAPTDDSSYNYMVSIMSLSYGGVAAYVLFHHVFFNDLMFLQLSRHVYLVRIREFCMQTASDSYCLGDV